jgi:hypothetical protein
MSESSFADLLFNNPDQALAPYELTAEESATLKSMRRTDFDQWTRVLPEERRSFGWTGNHKEISLNLPN